MPAKYATIVRGSHAGQQGEIVGHSRTSITVRTSWGDEIIIDRNWVVASSYDRDVPQVSRLFP
jgi:hypothetical protein